MRIATLLAALALTYGGAVHAVTLRPMHVIVEQDLLPQLDVLAARLRQQGLATRIAGYPAFNGKDKFLPGKVALGLSYSVLAAQDPAQALQDYRQASSAMLGQDNHSWGMYYYLLSLYKLQQAGLLEKAVSADTLQRLRRELDWRQFVSADYKLIGLPTNYYGVAFGVARLRMLLGWEDAQGSEQLLAHLLQHYQQHSGTYGWSDETDGEGRFDRYSILLIAEICERFIDTGLTPGPELKARLRQSAELALGMANPQGEGFSFGRSIGAYGDTAMLEILSIAAYLDVLSPEEKDYAYAYSSAIMERYMHFWYDPAMPSVDMWGKGRRTDGYRGIHRILGENYSLLHQLIKTDALWNQLGYRGRAPRDDLAAWLERSQPRFRLTRYARGEYDRALAVYRDGSHVFALSMINGGTGQHANSPYYPLPFATGLVAGVADAGPAHAQLLPKFTLEDGTELLPTAFFKDIEARSSGERAQVSYRQDALAQASHNERRPVADGRLQVRTEYSFAPGEIIRTDVYTPATPLTLRRVALEFASFSSQPQVQGGRIHFGSGAVSDFEVEGLPECQARSLQDEADLRAPTGAMQTLVSCSASQLRLDAPLTLRWRLRYH